jgi:hypothetical protein
MHHIVIDFQVLRLNVYDAKSKRHTSDQPTAQYEAVFVRDVTVPDGTNVTAKVKFQKVRLPLPRPHSLSKTRSGTKRTAGSGRLRCVQTWSVKNTSSAPWPKGVVLKMVDPKDDQLVVLGVGAINRVVGPGEETEIGVHLQAPSRPGRCVQYWRLFTEDGVAFGSRLWVDITVTQDNAAVERERLERMRLEEEERCLAEAEAMAMAEAQAMAEAERAKAMAEAEEEERRRYEEARRLAEEEEFRRRQEEEDAKRKQQQEEEERQRREEEERLAQLERQLAKEEAELRQKLEQEECEKRMKQEAEAEALRMKQEMEKEMLRQKEAARLQEEAEEKQRRLYSKYPGQLNALAEMGIHTLPHRPPPTVQFQLDSPTLFFFYFPP